LISADDGLEAMLPVNECAVIVKADAARSQPPFTRLDFSSVFLDDFFGDFTVMNVAPQQAFRGSWSEVNGDGAHTGDFFEVLEIHR
jgi:hypothetical protein